MTSLIQVNTPHALLVPTFTALTGSTGISWSNTGAEVVWIINGATASNYTINIGATVLGQAVAAFGPTACPVSNTAAQALGPFSAQYNQADGKNSVYIDFSSVATVTVAIVRMPGV
jgi:hypothetical protein